MAKRLQSFSGSMDGSMLSDGGVRGATKEVETMVNKWLDENPTYELVNVHAVESTQRTKYAGGDAVTSTVSIFIIYDDGKNPRAPA